MVAEKIKEDERREKYYYYSSGQPVEIQTGQGVTWWIETLLQTPIDDYRKHSRDLILVPYLVVRRGMTDPNQIIGIVMQWADRCAELRSLDPSRREFEKKLESRVEEVMQNRIPPMRWDTLQSENPELAQKLSTSRGS